MPPLRAAFSFPSLSCVRWVAALRRGFPTLHLYFNPRSPCGERLRLTTKHFSFFVFQSTLPVWGATAAPFLRHHKPAISIHAPRVGSDCRGSVLAAVFCISIHAPRVGSDQRSPTTRPPTPNFNPRSPCGERRGGGYRRGCGNAISIHAPRVGSDQRSPTTRPPTPNFNPRSPCGERPVASGFCAKMSKISIHAPRVGSDGTGATTADAALEFQSTLPVWGATRKPSGKLLDIHHFNPRSPCGERR